MKTKLDSKGQLLIEMIIAIMVAAVIVVAASNLFFVNLKEGKFTESRNDMLMLAQEGMEAVSSVAETSWHDIYLPPMGAGSKTDKGESNIYCLKTDGSSWSITSILSDCDISLNGRTYSRKIVIDNVNRDNNDISESSGSDDPSTQRIRITVSLSNEKDVVLEQYFTRWKNKIAKQDGWNSSDPIDQTACETARGIWNALLSTCSADLDDPLNESGWTAYSDLDGESGQLDTSSGSVTFK